MNSYQQLFLLGANELASFPAEYGAYQQAAGFTKVEWDLLTSKMCWTKAEQMKIDKMIASAVSITLRVAGLPPVPMPGAYVAAVICKLCAPCNRLVAAASAPESFDVMSASGIAEASVINITTKQQMYALVVYFSSAVFGALEGFRLDEMVEESVIEAQAEGNLV